MQSLPFRESTLEKLVVTDVLVMKGIGVVAINPNDYISFPETHLIIAENIKKSWLWFPIFNR